MSSLEHSRLGNTKERDNNLYLTNNYSIISKYSAIKSNYFKDDFLVEFIENHCSQLNKVSHRRRTPLVNRGYAARMLAMEWAVSRAIKYEKINCFIVLGSGFDMLPQRHFGECYWIEIDLKEVIKTKCQFIKSHWNLKENDCDCQNDAIINFPSLHSTFISCNLLDYEKLSNLLNKVLSTIRHDCKSIAIINEVCLCYSSGQQVYSILDTIIQQVSTDFCWQLHYIGFEQVKFVSSNQFSDIMLEHFSSIGHPLKYFPSQQDVIELFEDKLKFNHVTVASMFQIYHNALFSSTLANNINKLEPFDEFEEMDLYLSHYALITGVRIFKSPIKPEKISYRLCDSVGSITLKDYDCLESSFIVEESLIQRYGHASCSCLTNSGDTSQRILVTGGFGIDTTVQPSESHKRLDDCLLLLKESSGNKPILIKLNTESLVQKSIRLDRMHGQACYLGDDLIFFNGGRQSPTGRSAISANSSTICRVDRTNTRITVEHIFDLDAQNKVDYVKWRHRLIKLSKCRIIQVGGIDVLVDHNHDNKNSSFKIYRLDADKFGASEEIETINECFNRHSFGADQRDENTFLLFGGLKTNSSFIDQPVDYDINVIVCDLRNQSISATTNRPYQMKATDLSKSSYGCNVHFMNDYQFIKLGGVSTISGLQEDTLDLYDLRSGLGCPVKSELIPSHDKGSEHEKPLMLTNFTSHNVEFSKYIQTIGGGGNYFTFGTYFNKSQIVCKY